MENAGAQRLLSLPEVSAALGGISRSTVYNLIRTGQLTRVNIGSRAFITSDSLTAYLEKLSA